MKPKNKKVIVISSSSILIVAFFIWYFYPFIIFYWYCYRFDIFHKWLRLTPVYITALKSPPDKWENIIIEKLSMKLPVSEYTDVCGKEQWIMFKADKGFVYRLDFITEEVLKGPILSYQNRLKFLKSTPDDISFFHSRSKNMTAAVNQILKAIAVPNGGLSKILAVQSGGLSALCTLSEKRNYGCIDGYFANATLFNPDGTESFSLSLYNYKDTINLEADLLSILGGIKTPYKINDMDKVRKDVDGIVGRFKT